MRLRRGHSLAEALCALALSGLLAAAAGSAMLSSRRALALAESRERGGRAEREAVAIVRQAMASGAAILPRGDTAVELDLLLASAVACAVEYRALWLLWPSDAGLTAMPQLPTQDDLVAVRGWSPATADWWYAALDSVQERVTASPCAAAEGWRPAAASRLLRLVTVDTMPTDLLPGAQVAVYRRGRFALYHAGSGEWALGWRRCHPFTEVCGPIQPVASPLVTPGAGGFRVRALSSPNRWELSARGVGGHSARSELPW